MCVCFFCAVRGVGIDFGGVDGVAVDGGGGVDRDVKTFLTLKPVWGTNLLGFGIRRGFWDSEGVWCWGWRGWVGGGGGSCIGYV